jgi:gp16 family phage-associated protein
MSRSAEEAKQWIRSQDKTMSQWARENGYLLHEVRRVLSGESKCLYGRGREIAKKLGMQVPDSE